jgi:TRAP-type C4-dicarboxylate transport system permease small subunit
MFEKLEKTLYRIEKILIMIPFTAIFLTVVEQVFQRNFNLPIADTSDISLVSQATFTFLCVGLLVYTEGHITIEVHKMVKNTKLLFVIEFMAGIFIILIGVVFVYLSYGLLAFAFSSGSATMALQIPMWIPYGSMLLGMVFMIVHQVGACIRLIQNRHRLGELAENLDIENMR